MTTPSHAGDNQTLLNGAAVAETANAFAMTLKQEMEPGADGMPRTSTQPLSRAVGQAETWADVNGDAPSRERVMAAMSVQAWYRAAKARSNLISEKIPGGGTSASLQVRETRTHDAETRSAAMNRARTLQPATQTTRQPDAPPAARCLFLQLILLCSVVARSARSATLSQARVSSVSH